MNEHDPAAESLRKLRSLLSAAGFKHRAADPGRRQMTFGGTLREWHLQAYMNADWFHVYTVVCDLPAEAGLRADVLLWVMRKNAAHPLLKYSVTKNDQIVMEFEIRAEGVDAGVASAAVWYLECAADGDYRELVRVASGDARLDALAASFGGSEPSAGDARA